MIRTIIKEAAAPLGLNYIYAPSDWVSLLTDENCTFPIVILYPYQVPFDFGSNNKARHSYNLKVEVLLKQKRLIEGDDGQFDAYLNNARMKMDELKHAINSHAAVQDDSFSGNIVPVFNSAEVLFKNSDVPSLDIDRKSVV